MNNTELYNERSALSLLLPILDTLNALVNNSIKNVIDFRETSNVKY